MRHPYWQMSTALMLWAGLSCIPDPPQPIDRAANVEELTVKDDLAKLRTYVNLPQDVVAVKWLASSTGHQGRAPGPTDYELTAFVLLSEQAWATLAYAPPAEKTPAWEPPPNDDTVVIPRDLAEAILPPEILRTAETMQSGRLRFRGRVVESTNLARSPYRTRRAIRLGDGLYLALHTM